MLEFQHSLYTHNASITAHACARCEFATSGIAGQTLWGCIISASGISASLWPMLEFQLHHSNERHAEPGLALSVQKALAQDDDAAAIIQDAASDTATVLEDTNARHTLALLPSHTSK